MSEEFIWLTGKSIEGNLDDLYDQYPEIVIRWIETKWPYIARVYEMREGKEPTP